MPSDLKWRIEREISIEVQRTPRRIPPKENQETIRLKKLRAWHRQIVKSHDYSVYLAGRKWNRRRLAALKRAGNRCQECLSTDELNVHHLTYDNLFHERPEDLKVLCRECHCKRHGRKYDPTPPAKYSRELGLQENHLRDIAVSG